ncbi:MAG: nitrophenyl compound nitroreductase subunit ArsF family protein [Candidatus Eisenbacteria bacterium]
MRKNRSGWLDILKFGGMDLAVLMGLAVATCLALGVLSPSHASVAADRADEAAAAEGATEPVTATHASAVRDSAAVPAEASPADTVTVTAYYFHRTFRCETCLHMEQVIHDLLLDRFSKDLKRGRIRWQALDYEQEANASLYAGYGLDGGPAFVLSRRVGQREIEWREVGKIWGWSASPDEMDEYVAAQITQSLRPLEAGEAQGGAPDSTAATKSEPRPPDDRPAAKSASGTPGGTR